MRRVNVHLEEQLDDDLAIEAARSGESKAALLRQAAQALLDQRAAERGNDSWSAFTGAISAAAARHEFHDDEVIYRR